MKIIGKTASALNGHEAFVYEFVPHSKDRAALCYPNGKVACLSFLAKNMGTACTLRVEIVGPHSKQTQDFMIKDTWERFSLPTRNDISLRPMEIFLTAFSISRGNIPIAITGFQLVESLYVGPLIGPGPFLPAINDDPNEDGDTREADTTAALIDEPITSKDATIYAVITPQWETSELIETDFKTVFCLFSKEQDVEISVGASGSESGKFVIRLRHDNQDEIFKSDLIAGRQEYFVCLTMNNNSVTLIVNGYPIVSIQLNETTFFDGYYLGCTPRLEGGHLDGIMRETAIFPTAFMMPRILDMYHDLCPDHSHYFYHYINRFLHLALTDPDEMETLRELERTESFSVFASQITFALAKVYRQFKPGSEFIEDDIRDYVHALATRPDFDPIREEYSKIGRSDLTFEYPQTEKSKRTKYPIEFKIWGRAGWDSLPDQPLKYMGDTDLFGVCVMIDRRKKPEISEFEKIVNDNQNYPCTGISKFAFLETDLAHFYSFHKDPRFERLRMIANFHLTIR